MLQTGSLLFAAGFLICAMVVMFAIAWSFSDKRVIDAGLAPDKDRRLA